MTAVSQTQTVRAAAERRQLFVQENGILLVFIAFIIVATVISGGRFIQPANLSIILFQASVIGVLALGQTLVMLVAGIDLSIVAIAILAAIVMGAGGSMRQQEMNMAGGILPYVGFLPAIILAIVGSTIFGAINGLVVVKLRIPAFITTLATSLALSGVAMLTTSGTPVHYPDPFFETFGDTKIVGVPLTVYVFLGLALVFGFFLSRTKIGVMIYAIGGNPRAAKLSGIPVERITMLIYALSGLLGGIAGFVFLARTSSVTVASGGNLLMDTIAAVVVGGVSLSGGKGTIRNSVIGTLLLAALGNLLNIMLVSPHLQDAISGLIIVAAIVANVRMDRS